MYSEPATGINIAPYREKLAEVSAKLDSGDLQHNDQNYVHLISQFHELKTIVDAYDKLENIEEKLAQAKEMLQNKELSMLAEEEVADLEKQLASTKEELSVLTAIKLLDDDKSAIMEIRAGTGGIEASLFAEELYRMYARYLAKIHLPFQQLSINYQEGGGIKEAVFEITSSGAFGKMRFEAGVHRVQRVPSTESSGRIHTSASSIAVLPQIESSDVNIDPSELRIDVYRSSGPGGQSVNTTDSAVRITHIPTGITVSCQDGKSQHKNKEKALSVLHSKLYALQQEEQDAKVGALRSQAIQSGDRSAKIRTYNFPQGRLTDHRIQQSWFNITEIMEGEIDDVVKTVNTKLRGELAKEQDLQ